MMAALRPRFNNAPPHISMTSEVMEARSGLHYNGEMENTRRSAPSDARIGAMLREWRQVRRLSQLDLALQADISARHLSYVENGKAQPSREMIARLSESLAVPLRERNALLVAGGFAPRYAETGLGAPRLAQMRFAIEAMLAKQEPYPAFLLNRHWDVVMANEAARKVNRFMLGGRDSRHDNMLRQFFDPDDLRAAVHNWEDIAGHLLRHLHSEVAASSGDGRARTLLDEMLAYPGVPAHWRYREPGAELAPVMTTSFKRFGVELNFFSTITTFGTPRDVTLDELHIESCFPVDEHSAAFCRTLA